MHPLWELVLCFEEGENQEQVKYQAAHHELVASALATKLASTKLTQKTSQGCMLAGAILSYTVSSERDYSAAMEEDRKSYFFIDVQARWGIPKLRQKQWGA